MKISDDLQSLVAALAPQEAEMPLSQVESLAKTFCGGTSTFWFNSHTGNFSVDEGDQGHSSRMVTVLSAPIIIKWSLVKIEDQQLHYTAHLEPKWLNGDWGKACLNFLTRAWGGGEHSITATEKIAKVKPSQLIGVDTFYCLHKELNQVLNFEVN